MIPDSTEMTYSIDRQRRPRVLMVAYGCAPDRGSEAGGGWNRAVEASRFCDTWVICEEREFGEGIRRYLRQHGPIPGLTFHYVAQRRWESFLWRLPGLGYLAYNLWHRRVLRLARGLHDEHEFDLVHQVTFGTYREPGYLWKLNVPFVWGPFGGTQNYPGRFLARAGLRGALGETLRVACNHLQLRFGRRIHRAARRAALLLASNSTTQRDFAGVLGARPVLVCDMGMSESAGEPRIQRAAGPLRILWVGGLVPRKALDLLIDALGRLPEDVAYELRVVGAGPERRRWQRLARRRNVDRHITWVGHVPHREALAHYHWADVFAFTSLRDSVGTVLLEALGAGLPVICLDHQGARDVVTDRCGIKIPVTNPSEVISRLADAITRLARNPQQREQLGREALRRAQPYLWSEQGDTMAARYREVLQAARRRSLDGTPGIGAETSVAFRSAKDRHFRRAKGDHAAESETVGIRAGGDSHWATHRRRRLGSGAAVVLRKVLGARACRQFGILLYHRVATLPDGELLPAYTVTTRCFDEQMRGLLARGYRPWPLRKVLEHRAAGEPIPPGTFVVTFDDGYECIHDEAWPILRELKIPATIFSATAYLDSDRPLPFDDWPAGSSERVPAHFWRSLSTAECREMLSGGLIELGTHTHTHADFRGQPEAFSADLKTSLQVLGERFDVTEATFAFPFGHCSAALAAEARRAGVVCALTTEDGLVAPQSDPFDWGRLTVETYDTAATLAAKLDGWYDVLRRAWHWRSPRRAGNGSVSP